MLDAEQEGSTMLDHVAFGVVVVGRQSRRVLGFNRHLSAITGLPAEAVVGRPVAEVFAHVQGLDLEQMDAELTRSGCFEVRDLRVVRDDGEVVYRHARGDVVAAGDGGEAQVVVSIQDVTELQRVRQGMSRYLAREVAELVLSRRSESPIEGREVEVAILVADMRDFCTAAEGLTPTELFATLNTYLEPMVEAVARHGGMIDKFTGDGFMAVFGAPASRGGDARRALEASLEVRRAVAEIAAQRRAAGLHALQLGYGVHWGPALAGSLGSLLRMEYTVVGDTVNVAHRIQALAGPGEILATREVRMAAGNGLQWDDGRWVRVRGRRAPVKIHALQGAAA